MFPLRHAASQPHERVSSAPSRPARTNIGAILEAGGSDVDRIVSMTFILGDSADFAGMNEEWRR